MTERNYIFRTASELLYWYLSITHFSVMFSIFWCALNLISIMRWACIIASFQQVYICCLQVFANRELLSFHFFMFLNVPQWICWSPFQCYFFLEILNATNDLHWLNVILRNSASTLCAGVKGILYKSILSSRGRVAFLWRLSIKFGRFNLEQKKNLN